MELKIGDKVRYLDAVGGGTITAFDGKDQVLVLEEDGFETPVFKRQCVVITNQEMKPVKPAAVTRTINPQRPDSFAADPQPVKPVPVTVRQPFNPEGENVNISLAFLPEEDKPFNEARMECYLINDSNYTLLFNYASASGKSWKSRQAGEVEPNSKLFLESVEKKALPDMEHISVQALAFKKGTHYSWQQSFSVEIRLDTVKFYKVHCFKENDYFEDEALMVPLVQRGVAVRDRLINSDDLLKAMQQKEFQDKPRASQPLLKNTRQLVEIDLHINNLLDTTAGMSNTDMLNYQLDVFRQTMGTYKKEKGQKIVFIHGKGDGVLRSALLKELANSYKSCLIQDASFKEYGFGATQVTIR